MLASTPYDRFWQAHVSKAEGRCRAEWLSGTVLVSAYTEISPGWMRAELELPAVAAQARAGHFLLLGIPAIDPYLLRPHYIADINQVAGRVGVLFPRRTKLAQALSQLPIGAGLSFIGPLGTSFPDPTKANGPLLLIASGHGVAPLDLARSEAIAAGRPVLAVTVGSGPIWTGSHAVPDFETLIDLLASKITHPLPQAVWASGPEPLMAQVRTWATERLIDCFVTLERHIACGVGTCLGCTVPATGGGMWRVCADGPVFEAEEVVFHE